MTLFPGRNHVSYRDVAAALSISVKTVVRHVRRKLLPEPRRVGGRRLFVAAEVEQAVRQMPRGVGR